MCTMQSKAETDSPRKHACAHLHGYCEVYHSDLDAHFRQVVRVAHLCGDEQLKVGVVVHICVTQADEASAPHLEHSLLEDGLQRRVKRLTHILRVRISARCSASRCFLAIMQAGAYEQTLPKFHVNGLIKRNKDQGQKYPTL